MHINKMAELNDKQLEAISGGTYFTWLCEPHGGGGTTPSSGHKCFPPNLGTTIINNTNISIININNATVIDGTLLIGVNQSIYS